MFESMTENSGTHVALTRRTIELTVPAQDDHARRIAWAIANAGEARGAAARDSGDPRLAPRPLRQQRRAKVREEGAQP